MPIQRFEPGTRPEHYPGDEFSQPNTFNGITSKFYELYRLAYARTTSGQIVVLPQVEHRVLAEPGDTSTYDGAESIIPIDHLSDSQVQAIERASYLKSLREHELPVDTFPYLRKLAVDSQGLLWVCAPEEGMQADQSAAYAPVRSAVALGDVDVASAIYGHPSFPRYDSADLNGFIPDELVDRANAYVLMDAGSGWRSVTGNGDPTYKVAHIRLFEIESDLS